MESENKKNSLEDILIDNSDSQKQLKKILMIVALVIVILIVVIALTKMVIGGSDETQMASTTLPAPAQPREPLFEELPIESVSDADDELTRIINQLRDSELRQQEIQKQQLAQTPSPQTQPVEKIPQTITKPQTQVPSVAKDEQKYDPYRVKNGWYVQVSSFSKFTPNQVFLKNILDKGYKYYFYKTDIDNTQVTKVLIGPYATKDEAIAHRARIKEEINDDAFLFRVTDGI